MLEARRRFSRSSSAHLHSPHPSSPRGSQNRDLILSSLLIFTWALVLVHAAVLAIAGGFILAWSIFLDILQYLVAGSLLFWALRDLVIHILWPDSYDISDLVFNSVMLQYNASAHNPAMFPGRWMASS